MKKYNDTLADLVGNTGFLKDGDWVESKDQDPVGEVRLLQLADIGIGEYLNKSNRFLTKKKAKELKCTFLKPGDILIARMPDPIGRACIFPGDEKECVTVVDVCILRPDKEIAINTWVNYVINNEKFYSQLYKYVKGATRPRISRTNLEKIGINIPDIKLQVKIITILNKADSIRKKRRETIKLADEFLRSTFLEMFGDPFLNPREWKLFPVEELVPKDEKNAIKAGPFGSSLKKEFYSDSGYKIYGQEQVIKDDFNYGDYYINESKYKELENCKIKSGDILISLVGTYGEISIVPEKFHPGIINPRLMKITLDKKKMNPIFFKSLLKSHGMKTMISQFSHGGTMDILNVGIIKSLQFPKPNIDLQNKFAEIVEKTEKLKEKYRQSLEESENLFNSLMQRAFKGEL